jgi:hypothetical protein
MQLTRRTSAEVYAFIESDLTDAIAALPNKSVYAASKGKSFKRSSLCFSKVNLYPKEMAKVVDNANLVTDILLSLIMLRCLD